MGEQADHEQRARAFMALADTTRLQIVEMLAAVPELSTSEIAERLGVSLSLACHHTKQLWEVGLLDKRKEGQTKYNRLNRDLLRALLASLDSPG
ncbi:ArsR/SmtB family transcription factor [Gloeobacter kilaueensis]|uniref:ArsR family transcriptional regulator n=1 Tax=Gloeobacter kilaueensis (strain ATCC BAA-2537 / CCAP 1431/1 / ULC 316 / JS1) TaxID=1183438 RepID=U5QNZ5_GLOK1|nr:metalloregulator ArsR/SmtB family transcription factor [Gloeobacter kilaueensis]AGY59360.1 ArsR family transcriptional regulator [Gloeobacter kilaueensis JS1]